MVELLKLSLYSLLPLRPLGDFLASLRLFGSSPPKHRFFDLGGVNLILAIFASEWVV
jgi:hypothetical protein